MQTTQPLDVTAHVAGSIVPAVLDVIGQRWSLAIIQALLLQTKSFSQLLAELSIPRSTLASRLKHLQQMTCLSAVTNGYQLSPAGQALMPVIVLANTWDKAAGLAQPQVMFRHQCAQPLAVDLHCSVCEAAVKAQDTVLDAAGEPLELDGLPKPARRSRAEFSSTQSLTSAEILGDRWTALVVALGFYGVHRYSDIARHLGIAPNILADRLQRLSEGGVLERQLEGQTDRALYQLSARGLALFPLIVALTQWGDCWLRPRTSSPTRLRHLPCGQLLHGKLVCKACNNSVTAASLISG